jgi:hypothetical protein
MSMKKKIKTTRPTTTVSVIEALEGRQLFSSFSTLADGGAVSASSTIIAKPTPPPPPPPIKIVLSDVLISSYQ